MFKFVFILAIGLLASGIFVYSYFGEKKGEEEDFKDMFDFEENNENINLNVDELDIKELEGEVTDDTTENENVDEEVDEWTNDNVKNKKKFGEEKLREVKKVSEQAIIMWFEEIDDEKEWEGLSTTPFLYYMSENIIDEYELKRKVVTDISVFTPSDDREGQLTTESIVEFYYEGNEDKKFGFVVLITFEMQGEKPLIDNLVIM